MAFSIENHFYFDENPQTLQISLVLFVSFTLLFARVAVLQRTERWQVLCADTKADLPVLFLAS